MYDDTMNLMYDNRIIVAGKLFILHVLVLCARYARVDTVSGISYDFKTVIRTKTVALALLRKLRNSKTARGSLARRFRYNYNIYLRVFDSSATPPKSSGRDEGGCFSRACSFFPLLHRTIITIYTRAIFGTRVNEIDWVKSPDGTARTTRR